MRLKLKLSEETIEQLNQNFSDILTEGKISQSAAFPEEHKDLETLHLPRLSFYFNQKSHGRLYQLIAAVNKSGVVCEATEHPEVK